MINSHTGMYRRDIVDYCAVSNCSRRLAGKRKEGSTRVIQRTMGESQLKNKIAGDRPGSRIPAP